MATKDGAARGSAEVALKLQSQAVTRDALLDPQPGDYIPDNETKGYHVGETRQPAEIVLPEGSTTPEFETIGDKPSKFGSFAEQKAAVDAQTAAYEGSDHAPLSVPADPRFTAKAVGDGQAPARPKSKAPAESAPAETDAAPAETPKE